jgi:hypothetical protein
MQDRDKGCGKGNGMDRAPQKRVLYYFNIGLILVQDSVEVVNGPIFGT